MNAIKVVTYRNENIDCFISRFNLGLIFVFFTNLYYTRNHTHKAFHMQALITHEHYLVLRKSMYYFINKCTEFFIKFIFFTLKFIIFIRIHFPFNNNVHPLVEINQHCWLVS